MVGIYKITSPTNKIYIGQSINIPKRIGHYRCYDKSVQKQPKLYASLRKYGFDSHIIEIVHELPKDVSIEILNNYEVFYISQYASFGFNLMNVKEGGNNGRHSEETKAKIKNNWRGGNRTISEETREKMRLVGRQPKPYRVGLKMSDKARANMRLAAKNRKRPFISEERRKQLVELAKNMISKRPKIGYRKGIKHTDESKKKMSDSLKGRMSPFRKKVVCIETGKVYESIKEAAIAIGLKHSTLIAKLRGQSKNNTSFRVITNKH